MLAILKAGGAYVPLNPDDPVRRLGLLIADSASPVLLTQRRLADRLPACAGTTLCLDTDWADIAGLAASAPPRSGNAARLAYVIHTSGSTGQPKGVMIEQRSLVGHLVAVQSQFGGTATDCVLQTSPLSFDQSIWQILFPLVCGGCVALPEPGAHRAADEIVADIRRHGVTILRIVPALLAAIVGGPGLRECPSLRLVIVAGEVLEPALAESFAAQCGAELVNAYGPTEATFVSTSFRFQAGSGRHTVPIGRPIGDARLYVVDPHDQPLPIGVPGELCIGGPGVGRGYWRQPELTARAFVPDPFAMDPQARMYRTGDIARYLADGNLEFLGGAIARSRSAACASSSPRSMRRWPRIHASRAVRRSCGATPRAKNSWSRTTSRATARRSPRPSCVISCVPGCPPAWFHRTTSRCRRCRRPRTASWTARHCRRPSRMIARGRLERITLRRAATSRRESPRYGRRRCGCRAWGSTATSSTSVGTRCSR